MSISVSCPSCKKSYGVKDKYAGRRGKCPFCRVAVDVPGNAPAVTLAAELPLAGAVAHAKPEQHAVAPATLPVCEQTSKTPTPAESKEKPQGTVRRRSEAELMQAIDAAFRGEIPSHSTSVVYLMSLSVVALFVVLLPLVYLGLIGMVLAGMLWWTVAGLGMFAEASSRTAVMLYLIPLGAGACVLPALVKPLFASDSAEEEETPLEPDEEPVLFHFVYRLCEVLGAPRPEQIQLVYGANAAARGRSGWAGFVFGRFDLILGMDLISGMTVTQLAGVVAHELGHFNQGLTTRLERLIGRVSRWFAHAIFVRDDWDEQLVEWRQSEYFVVSLMALTAQGGVWLSRQLMKGLLWTCGLVTYYHRRQMEFDADLCEARIAGSELFGSTTHKLILLNYAGQRVLNQVEFITALPDDLSQVIAHEAERTSPELEGQIKTERDRETTRWFASHPPDRLRIKRVERKKYPGVFRLELPASVVFRNFSARSRMATLRLYQKMELKFDPAALIKTEQFEERLAGETARYDAGARYFQLLGVWDIILPDAPLSKPFIPSQHLTMIKQVRERMLGTASLLNSTYDKVGEVWARYVDLAQQESLFRVELMSEARDSVTGQKYESLAELETELARLQKSLLDLYERTSKVGKLAGARLFAGLQLLRHPKLAAKLPEGIERNAKYEPLLAVARQLRNDWPLLRRLLVEQAKAEWLLQCWHGIDSKVEGVDRNEPSFRAASERVMRARAAICNRAILAYSRLRDSWQHLPYPFEYTRGGQSLADVLLPNDMDELSMVLDAIHVHGRATHTLTRVWATLGEVATQVEAALEMPPLAEPVTGEVTAP